MTSYTPKYVKEMDVRNFFTPALDYDDIGTAELLLKIESVEKFVEVAYFNNLAANSNDVRIPCLLLIASKIIMSPTLARRYYTLNSETLGDYSYTIASPSTRQSDVQSSPHVISITWEKMALEILDSLSPTKKWGLWKAND
jgi:hypothetical protein